VSAKPTNWVRPILAVRWNLPVGARVTVRSRVRASAGIVKGELFSPRPGGEIHSFRGRTNRDQRPLNQLRAGRSGICRGSGWETG
jgi:hypothetical protein